MKKYYKLDEYQETAMNTLYTFKDKEEQLKYAVLALCGESGELANTLKKIVYYKNDSKTKADMIEELSDVLWYVACVADALNIRLSELATFSIKKILAKQNRTETDGEYPEGYESCNTEYKQKCPNKNCDNEIILYTREDYKPEYHTTVAVKCDKCGCKVWFSLPVN